MPCRITALYPLVSFESTCSVQLIHCAWEQTTHEDSGCSLFPRKLLRGKLVKQTTLPLWLQLPSSSSPTALHPRLVPLLSHLQGVSSRSSCPFWAVVAKISHLPSQLGRGLPRDVPVQAFSSLPHYGTVVLWPLIRVIYSRWDRDCFFFVCRFLVSESLTWLGGAGSNKFNRFLLESDVSIAPCNNHLIPCSLCFLKTSQMPEITYTPTCSFPPIAHPSWPWVRGLTVNS